MAFPVPNKAPGVAPNSALKGRVSSSLAFREYKTPAFQAWLPATFEKSSLHTCKSWQLFQGAMWPEKTISLAGEEEHMRVKFAALLVCQRKESGDSGIDLRD